MSDIVLRIMRKGDFKPELWERVKAAIAECKAFDELKEIRDKAEALRQYAKQANESLQVQNDLAEIKLRAQRRLGELSLELPTSDGGRPSKNSRHDDESLTKAEILKESGLDPSNIHRLEAIATLSEEKFEGHIREVREKGGELTTAAMVRVAKQSIRQAENALIAATDPGRIDGLYDVIVIDPPWPMKKTVLDVRPDQIPELDYPVMLIEQLLDLRIPAAPNCHLFLWTTQRFLPIALELLKAWGFRYVCIFVWHKPGGPQQLGLPQYNCEFALYARKGTPHFRDRKDFHTCFSAERGKHSEKPALFYETVRRVTSGRRLDMFSRRRIEGFDCWGNEV